MELKVLGYFFKFFSSSSYLFSGVVVFVLVGIRGRDVVRLGE